MPVLITEAQLRQIEQALLGRINLAPRSITEDKLAVGAASASVVRGGAISNIHIGTLSVEVLTGGTITGQTIILAAGGTIRSSSITATSGWQIQADGSAEFQNVTVRGVLNAQVGSTMPGTYITSGATGANLTLSGDLVLGGSLTLDGVPGLIRTAVSGRRVEIVSGSAIYFYSTAVGERGYVGYTADEHMRLWNEAPAGLMQMATNNIERFRISAAGMVDIGNTTTPVAVTHRMAVLRAHNPIMQAFNEAPVGGSNNAHGIDIYLGAPTSPSVNTENGDHYMRFRRPDGTVLGHIRGNGGGTDYVVTSDRKFKSDITTDLTDACEAFDEIPWRSWRWTEKGTFGAGVVAQQLAKVPRWEHLVHRGGMKKDADHHTGKVRKYYDTWGVSYIPLIGVIGAKLADVDRRLRALENDHG